MAEFSKTQKIEVRVRQDLADRLPKENGERNAFINRAIEQALDGPEWLSRAGKTITEAKSEAARNNGKTGGRLANDEFNVFLTPTKTSGVKKQHEQLVSAIKCGMALKVKKDGKLRLLRLEPNPALNTYKLVVEYPPDASGQKQRVGARVQPQDTDSVPDIRFWAKKNDFETVE